MDSVGPVDRLPTSREGLLQAQWTRDVAAPVTALWAAVEESGGDPAFEAFGWVWRARADLDALLGGPGRGHPTPPGPLHEGDPVGLWTVESVRPGSRLVLRAGSRMPGTAWLEILTFAVTPTSSRLVMRQPFRPSGALGALYWRAERPGHHLVYARAADGLARRAEAAVG